MKRIISPTLSLFLLAVVSLAGCKKDDPPIVAEAKQNGVTDPSSMPEPTLDHWLTQHRDVAIKLNNDCAKRRSQQPPLTDVEAKICSAAAAAATFTNRKMEGTGKKY